ncbi:MAG: prepilin-type N-terminal cleavage/methylation domain-containing protein [Vampirovibrio sp.]
MKNRSLQAFTLAELLVSLSVLGLVAAFAIPKVLISVSDQSTKAAGREAFAMINDAFMAYKAEQGGIVDSGATTVDLVKYMNYKQALSALTTPTLNAGLTAVNGVTAPTSAIQLLNGLVVGYLAADTMTDNTSVVGKGTLGFDIDPDGPGAAAPITIYLGSDGRAFAAYGYELGTSGTTANPLTANTAGNYGTLANEADGIKAAATGLYPSSAKTSWWVS